MRPLFRKLILLVPHGQMAVVSVILLVISNSAHGRDGLVWEKSAVNFDRYELADPTHLDVVGKSGNLGGQVAGKWAGVQGAFEYDIHIDESGWYELYVDSADKGPLIGQDHDYVIDGTIYLNASMDPGWREYDDFKVGNVWLGRGGHTLRIENWRWQGFHPLETLRLYKSGAGVEGRVHIRVDESDFFAGPFLRESEPLVLEIFSDGNFTTRLSARIWSRNTNKPFGNEIFFPIPKSNQPLYHRFEIDGMPEGAWELRFSVNNRPALQRHFRRVEFDVIGNRAEMPGANSADVLSRSVVKRIDCAAKAPDYVGGRDVHEKKSGEQLEGKGRIGSTDSGAHRESGNVGFRQHRNNRDPSWFAYRLPKVDPDELYVLEVDYPDDAFRSFLVNIYDDDMWLRVPSNGVDTGGEFPLSNRIQTHEMLYWPRSKTAPRVVLLNAQNGSRAACKEIRLSRVDRPMPALLPEEEGKRSFGHWFEEGNRWAAVFGADLTNGWPNRMGYVRAAERWAQTLRYLGGDTMAVDANVYAIVMYPSRKHSLDMTSPYALDLMQLLLIMAEKYGLKVVLGLHPRANELLWEGKSGKAASDRLLLDFNGDTRDSVEIGRGRGARTEQPYMNPLLPDVKDWLVNTADELSERYSTSPAFAGISLRFTSFENRSMHNFHNLMWGYGDYTATLLRDETGIDVIDHSPQERYRILTEAGMKRRWLEWRGKHVADTLERVAGAVGNNGDDLKLYLLLIQDEKQTLDLPGAGIDPSRLEKNAVIKIVAGHHQYGRNGRVSPAQVAMRYARRNRDRLLDPDAWKSYGSTSQSYSVLFPAEYVDEGGVILSNDVLGLKKQRHGYQASGHIVPAGRQYLERFAVAMANANVTTFLHGGNGYFIDQPVIREFLSVYRRLPDVPFNRQSAQGDSIAVWTGRDDSDFVAYLVNQEPVEANIVIRFDSVSSLVRLSDKALLEVSNDTLRMKLKPFELFAMRGREDTAIGLVDVRLPEWWQRQIESQVISMEKLAVSNALEVSLRKRAGEIAKHARRAIDEGRTAEARRYLQSSGALEILHQAGLGESSLMLD